MDMHLGCRSQSSGFRAFLFFCQSSVAVSPSQMSAGHVCLGPAISGSAGPKASPCSQWTEPRTAQGLEDTFQAHAGFSPSSPKLQSLKSDYPFRSSSSIHQTLNQP